MIKKLLNTVAKQRRAENRAKLQHGLMRREAKVGGTVFGPVNKHQRREFFCLDENTWVWHEEWVDKNGERHIVTTRYDVRPSGILKSQNGSHYQRVTPEEAYRLYEAAELYRERVKKEVYNFA
jgi:hypothetical protein